ncbi:MULTISPECIES: SDR family oxidoreductase [Tessaracoccus]|uniref:SDR family oxidoreductase n=1 Tax=Tessaracoccus TaxID=72763 RepID=UPI00099C612E|nr:MULTISPECIES: SDR family oxidoreductase [Tessaracoccus]VEP39134.1 NAD(P)H azoreductase [Tessaracoccus lapidicaptus]
MSTVFLTGATGTVGAAVAAQLAARGERVIAGVRSGHAARRLPDGVEARLFDFASPPEQLRRVMGGADRLFLMRPPQIADVQRFLIPVIDAAQDLGMRQVVFLSLQGVQFNRNTPHHQVEAYLKATRAPYTMLRPNFFMQNLSSTYAADIARHSEIRVPAGRSRTAFIDARDIGAVVARVLTEPGHDRKAYTLSGEQSLSYTDVAQIMSRVLGRPITYTRPTEHEYLAQLAADGRPADYIAVQKMIYRVVRLNASAVPNRSIRRLTGSPATRFDRFVNDHRDLWEQRAS